MNQDHFWNLFAKNLAGEASEKEKAELVAIIQSHPELSFAAQHVADIWTLKEKRSASETEEAFERQLLVLENEAEKDWPPNKTAVQEPDFRKRGPALLLISFVCLVSAVGGFFWSHRVRSAAGVQERIAETVTRPGARTKLVLSDGSVVWLNAGSKLTYPQRFGEIERTVTLDGEAFFDIAKNGRPFVIHTAGVQIKVLGTAFNVRSYPSEKKVETSLVRGGLEITIDKSPEKKYVLKPAEKLTLNTDEPKPANSFKKEPLPMAVLSTLHYLNDTTVAETSWVENKLVFADETFADVARMMERWYGVTIRFKAEGLEKERLTGVFEKETVWQALEAMQLTTPFRYSTKNNEIIITP